LFDPGLVIILAAGRLRAESKHGKSLSRHRIRSDGEVSMKGSSVSRRVNRAAEHLAGTVAAQTGGTAAFAIALGIVLVWLALGPLFHFSDSWQLVINTATTIVTFLMVFLIQRAQNKEFKASALKMNEMIAAMQGASNRLIDVEDLSEEELEVLHKHFRHLVEMSRKDALLTVTHSVEEAMARHHGKGSRR
jgi:low affinity Fe/Cu permease